MAVIYINVTNALSMWTPVSHCDISDNCILSPLLQQYDQKTTMSGN